MALAFDPDGLSIAEKAAILRQTADRSLLTQEKMAALHVVLGDDLFFVLFLLAGDEIRFPPQRELKRIYAGVVGRTEGLNG